MFLSSSTGNYNETCTMNFPGFELVEHNILYKHFDNIYSTECDHGETATWPRALGGGPTLKKCFLVDGFISYEGSGA